ncbi:MAG: carboxypeptidase-like regulatory domain-containing protein, partial [Bryobacteraceae bacterium]
MALVLAAQLWSQDTRGTIYGTVLDPQSAAVAGASVILLNTDTNARYPVTTNATGYFEVSLLIPGNYQVSAQFSGFKTSVRGGILLQTGGRIDVDMALEVGGASEKITVSAEAPLLDTSSVSSGRTIESRSIADLPVLSGSSILFARQAVGVQVNVTAEGTQGPHATQPIRNFSSTGGVGGNSYSIDGIPNQGAARAIA